MSTQAAARFLVRFADDPSLHAGGTREERIAAAVALGRQNGLEFTGEECATLLEAVHKHGQDQLSDEELEQVAGGGYYDPSNQTASPDPGAPAGDPAVTFGSGGDGSDSGGSGGDSWWDAVGDAAGALVVEPHVRLAKATKVLLFG